MRAEDSGIEPTLATISILFDCCLGQVSCAPPTRPPRLS
jgi:hypothetical protein